jgi:hypothetical protein
MRRFISLSEHLKSAPALQEENKELQEDCAVVDKSMVWLEH